MDVRWWSVLFTNLLLACLFRLTSTYKQQGSCYFPERWEGTWFQSGVRQPIVIEGARLSSKGRCLGSEGDKFLVVDDKRACYRCVVIHEKHPNVLQYKETFCHGRDSLSTLCSLITGDALLFSMFRENAAPVPCPFLGQFTFTYNRGHGECRTPVSSIDTCIVDSRLLLSYQACPDVYGSESTVEELQCLALWKEGSSRYLVGKVHHNHATSNEDRFRCFVYEKASTSLITSPEMSSIDEGIGGVGGGAGGISGIDYRVAQSGDATCNGLFSATEGSRTMILKKAPPLNKCRFPSWLANYNHWHTLDYSATYSFHHKDATLRITNVSSAEMKVVCNQLKTSRDENSAIVLTHFTMGCQSGFRCMSFYRRDVHVIEVQIGVHTKRQEDACNPAYFNRTNLPYVTLVTTTPETRACPYSGKFQVSNLIRSDRSSSRENAQPDSRYYDSRGYYPESRFSAGSSSIYDDDDQTDDRFRRIKRVDQSVDCDTSAADGGGGGGFTSLVIGCNSMDTMEFKAHCPSPDLVTSYSCHGRWEENGTNYLIATPLSRASHGARRYCFIYKEIVPDTVLFSTSADNCDRIIRPGITGELIFNVTSIGKCIETSSSNAFSLDPGLLALALIAHILKTFAYATIQR